MTLRNDEEIETLGDEVMFTERAVVAADASPPVAAASKPKWELKHLTVKHKKIINMKVAGFSRDDIATECKVAPGYVSILFMQPIIKEYFQARMAEVDQDLRDLTGMAVGTVREMMGSGDDKVALSAATTVLRANGKLKGDEQEERVSAEDVVSQLLAVHGGTVNVQVNNFGKD